MLEAAPPRPLQKHTYERESGLATLAAAYAFGLAKAHPFIDGNRCGTLLAAMLCLGLNGKDLDATEAEVVQVITALAAGCPTATAPALVGSKRRYGAVRHSRHRS